MITTAHRFSSTELHYSWENVMPTLEKMFDKVQVSEPRNTVSKSKRRAAYKLYRHLSGEFGITIRGIAKALRNDRQDAIQFYFDLTDEEILHLKVHFALYHPATPLSVPLPGTYTYPVKEFFAKYFPSVEIHLN